jgi:hypothetical protein
MIFDHRGNAWIATGPHDFRQPWEVLGIQPFKEGVELVTVRRRRSTGDIELRLVYARSNLISKV